MNIKIVPYQATMKNDVVDLCLRNFNNVPLKTASEWNHIIETVTGYQWINEIKSDEYPYRSGMVLLSENDAVVGYMGLIHSKQVFQKRCYTIVCATTLVIDKQYSFYMLQMILKMHELADIVLDLSPIKPLRELLKDRLNYTSIEDQYYSFYPIPSFAKKGTHLRIIDTPDEIDDYAVKNMFSDHVKYGVKCLCVERENNRQYIILKDSIVKKGIFKFKISNVLFNSNPQLVCENIKAISWFLFMNNRSFLISDKRFIGELPDKHYIVKHSAECLAYSKELLPETISLLYTEKPMILL